MADGGPIQVTGRVVTVLPGTLFRVELVNGHQVLAHVCGKLRKKFMALRWADRVRWKWCRMICRSLYRGQVRDQKRCFGRLKSGARV
jgi:translation initiation factor IF-1